MTRNVAIVPVAGLVLAACAHDRDGERAGTATITGASPGGVRVTNVTIGDFDPAERLASELCRREATCGRTEAGGSDEAKLLGEQSCVTRRAPGVRAMLEGFGCAPATDRALFEDCLAAVRSERCGTGLPRADTLPACREEVICAR